MLKKLIKLNDTSLLGLDEISLEAMGLQEGTFVKVTSDGTSLIITPVPDALIGTPEVRAAAQVTYERSMVRYDYTQLCQQPESPLAVECNALLGERMMILEKLAQKYNILSVMIKLQANADYQKAKADVAALYDPVRDMEDHIKATLIQHYTFAPELLAYHQEMYQEEDRIIARLEELKKSVI